VLSESPERTAPTSREMSSTSTQSDAGLAGREALQSLTEMIASKQLGPGAKLPTERQLAATLGVSRNTVREAISRLEVLGVLDIRRGDGTYVTSLEPGVLLEATSFVVQLLHDNSALEMLEVRAILETAAAEMAALRISDDELLELEHVLDDFGGEPFSDKWLEADQRFHNLVAAASGNDVLASFLSSLLVGTYSARHVQGDVRLPRDQLQSSIEQHRRIYEAIANHDPRAAGFEAGAHVTGTLTWLRALREGAR
jgi:GntR family transcriptional repressor for pyruvate dehydrogenase complex